MNSYCKCFTFSAVLTSDQNANRDWHFGFRAHHNTSGLLTSITELIKENLSQHNDGRVMFKKRSTELGCDVNLTVPSPDMITGFVAMAPSIILIFAEILRSHSFSTRVWKSAEQHKAFVTPNLWLFPAKLEERKRRRMAFMMIF
uniref:Uncharacterized protein n=1 Tax=Glossina austeni TaxID=7395 RepID=A0A1A9UHN1_GLOAU